MLWVLIRIASAILMSTHNIGFYEDLTKIIFELSSNTHLIFVSCQTCLLLLSVDRDSFFILSECRNKIRDVSMTVSRRNKVRI